MKIIVPLFASFTVLAISFGVYSSSMITIGGLTGNIIFKPIESVNENSPKIPDVTIPSNGSLGYLNAEVYYPNDGQSQPMNLYVNNSENFTYNVGYVNGNVGRKDIVIPAYFNVKRGDETIKAYITDIEGNAFTNTNVLERLILPSSLKEIKQSAFGSYNAWWYKSITQVIMLSPSLPILGSSNALPSKQFNYNLYVPSSALDNYKAELKKYSNYKFLVDDNRIFSIEDKKADLKELYDKYYFGDYIIKY